MPQRGEHAPVHPDERHGDEYAASQVSAVHTARADGTSTYRHKATHGHQNSAFATHTSAAPSATTGTTTRYRTAHAAPAASPRPNGASTDPYNHRAGSTTRRRTTHTTPCPSGTSTYRHKATHGHQNNAFASQASAATTGCHTVRRSTLPAATSASQAIRTGTTSTRTTIRTGQRIATANAPSASGGEVRVTARGGVPSVPPGPLW